MRTKSMKVIGFVLMMLLACPVMMYGQTENGDKIYDICEEMPSFPEGLGALYKYINYDAFMEVAEQMYGDKLEFSAGSILIQFVVEKDGTLTNFKPLKSTTRDYRILPGQEKKRLADMEAEITENAPVAKEQMYNVAKKILSKKKWIPGKQGGKPVRAKQTHRIILRHPLFE